MFYQRGCQEKNFLPTWRSSSFPDSQLRVIVTGTVANDDLCQLCDREKLTA